MSFVRNTLISAGLTTVGTTLVTALLGRQEAGSAAAPLNATSHIVYGDEAARHDELSVEYTLVGGLLNASAMIGWAALQELVLGRWVRRGGPERAAAAGVATSAVAYVTDYHVVPERLTPGFEKRLSPVSLAIVYGVLAATLAVGVRKGR